MRRARLRTPPRWLRLPRRTVRLRLTLLYGALFLASGAALLGITYVLVQHAFDGPFRFASSSGNVSDMAGSGTGSLPGLVGRVFSAPAGLTPGQLRVNAAQVQVIAGQAHALDMQQLLIGSGIALAVMAVVSIALGWIVAGHVLSPLRTITTTTRDISASNLDRRLALAGPDDELKELGDTIDGLLARLETAFRSQRQFVANASHELRTPLARQRALIQVALSDPEPTVDSLRAGYERALAAEEQEERLIEALLTLTRSQGGLDRREPFDLAAVTERVLAARGSEAERRGLAVEADLAPAAALGDPRLVERLVANLVDNALRHNVPHGQVSLSSVIRDGVSVLSIANTGPIIPPEAIERLLQPFQRLGANRVDHTDGLGLGLSIVQAIAVAHGAALALSPRPVGGLVVEVRFPALTAEPPARASRGVPSASSTTRMPVRPSA